MMASRHFKTMPPIHVAIAGCAVNGSILASQLAQNAAICVTVIERCSRGGLLPGLNLLLNHNGLAACHESREAKEAAWRDAKLEQLEAVVDSSDLYVGFFGNFSTPPGVNKPIPPVAKTAATELADVRAVDPTVSPARRRLRRPYRQQLLPAIISSTIWRARAAAGHAPLDRAPILAQVQHQQRAPFSTSIASTVAPTAKLLVARTATRSNFHAFGDIVTPSADGNAWSPETDATLEGFDGSCGMPRLYLMELPGPRPLSFDRITHHARVTQCLGAASANEDFYLAVHEPTLGVEGGVAAPDPTRVQVFRIAPHNFVKLHKGTWHAGPLWGEASRRVFYNLELHDTNETDHTTFVFSEAFAFERCA